MKKGSSANSIELMIFMVAKLRSPQVSIKNSVNFVGMLSFCGGKEILGFKKLLELIWTLVKIQYVFH